MRNKRERGWTDARERLRTNDIGVDVSREGVREMGGGTPIHSASQTERGQGLRSQGYCTPSRRLNIYFPLHIFSNVMYELCSILI